MDITMGNGTFKTAYDYNTAEIEKPYVGANNGTSDYYMKEMKLPNLVNFVTLRETFLSECPFITRNNKNYWKHVIDTKQYINILAASYAFVSDCIAENGTIFLHKFSTIENNSSLSIMALNIAEMIIISKKNFNNTNDIIFKKLPELLCYMIISSLSSCHPKHLRVYNSVKFREILLDWLLEMINGFRVTNSKRDREWLFTTANDVHIMIVDNNANNNNNNNDLNMKNIAQSNTMSNNSNYNTMQTINTFQSTGKSILNDNNINKTTTTNNNNQQNATLQSSQSAIDLSKLGSATSIYNIENSPLISAYFQLGKPDSGLLKSNNFTNSLKIKLSHIPQRPIITLNQEEVLINPGKFRKKITDARIYNKTMKKSVLNRKEILSKYEEQTKEMKHDLHKSQEAFSISMRILKKQPITAKQQQLLASTNKDNMIFGGSGGANMAGNPTTVITTSNNSNNNSQNLP
eukprot:gene14342-19235_t